MDVNITMKSTYERGTEEVRKAVTIINLHVLTEPKILFS